MTIALSLVAVIAMAMLFAQFVMRYVYSYDITTSAVRILLFTRIPVVVFPLADTYYLAKCSPSEYVNPWSAIRFGNRLFGPGLMLRCRRGLMSSVIISPDNPDLFIVRFNELRASVVGMIESSRGTDC
jgi:hypothetical protein